ncbi:unnamed protein product [Fusarium venenatum]|uniref:Uncharacterized protein n=1 Tax=Fusarium venenatum TaxID=56646 RepID=A0A2L2TK45_9HYPO|nr:uncharacterized protein FVRRES_13438 [Fusarium venenatum]CEI41137.1 unnamed protein product [Fusarium venenatum]
MSWPSPFVGWVWVGGVEKKGPFLRSEGGYHSFHDFTLFYIVILRRNGCRCQTVWLNVQ